jgi:DNA replication protein DnaC
VVHCGYSSTHAGLSAFWLDIKITAGTNTKAEMAAFVKAVFEGLTSLLGPLHIHVTSAILDRVLHHAETVIIEGKSFRMKDEIEE